MPNPPNTEDQAATEYDAHRAAREAATPEDPHAGKPTGESVTPPTVPITGVNVPDPTTGGEPESKDPVRNAERKPDSPDAAAKDGLA